MPSKRKTKAESQIARADDIQKLARPLKRKRNEAVEQDSDDEQADDEREEEKAPLETKQEAPLKDACSKAKELPKRQSKTKPKKKPKIEAKSGIRFRFPSVVFIDY